MKKVQVDKRKMPMTKMGSTMKIKKLKIVKMAITRAMNRMTMTPQLLIPNMKKMMRGKFDDEDYKGIVFIKSDILCNVQENAGIPSSWILLDSQSTVDVFCNLKMLHNV